jgi:hypothetical protein
MLREVCKVDALVPDVVRTARVARPSESSSPITKLAQQSLGGELEPNLLIPVSDVHF